MKWFGQRKGFEKVSEVIQIDSMSIELRTSIWNTLDVVLWSSKGYLHPSYGTSYGVIEGFSKYIWFDYFKEPIDSRRNQAHFILEDIRDYFFECKWFEVYSFLEAAISYHVDMPLHREYAKLPKVLNAILERELSGYRIIDGLVTEITDKQEIKMLEESLGDTKYKGVNAHLRRALELLSDRDKPDYRNSIKESISAVESMARSITGTASATLGKALKVLEENGKIHPALKKGFSNLYGFTSDEGGIRHAMLDEPNITVADARYFLLSCTSFINYLKSQI